MPGLMGTGIGGSVKKMPPEIILIDSDEDGAEQLTDNEIREWGSLVWSPDGRRFAVAGGSHYEECRTYLVEVSDGTMRAITPDRELACASPVDWSADGKWILLSVAFHDGPREIYKVRPDGSGLKGLVCFADEGQEAYAARWLSDGSVFFAGNPKWTRQGIYRTSDDAKGAEPLFELPPWRKARQRKWLGLVAMHPDNRRAAFIVSDGRKEATSADEVFLLPIGASGPQQITFNRTHETSMSWSPRGNTLAIVEGNPYGPRPSPRIRVLDLRSGSSLLLPRPSEGSIDRWSAPRWSPSGRHLAFLSERRDGARAVFVAGINGVKLRMVTQFHETMSLMDWR